MNVYKPPKFIIKRQLFKRDPSNEHLMIAPRQLKNVKSAPNLTSYIQPAPAKYLNLKLQKIPEPKRSPRPSVL